MTGGFPTKGSAMRHCNEIFGADHNNQKAADTAAELIQHIETKTEWPSFSNPFPRMKIYDFRLRFH